MRKLDRDALRDKRLAGRGSLAGTFPPAPDEALLGGLTDAELAEAFGGIPSPRAQHASKSKPRDC